MGAIYIIIIFVKAIDFKFKNDNKNKSLILANFSSYCVASMASISVKLVSWKGQACLFDSAYLPKALAC